MTLYKETRISLVDDKPHICFRISEGFRIHSFSDPFPESKKCQGMFSGQINHKAFREISRDLKENRSILKPIDSNKLIKRTNKTINTNRLYNPDRIEFLEEMVLTRALGRS